MNRIILGTAQFGMDYGINNKRGRIPQKEAWEIVDESIRTGVDTLDTASLYGLSETVLGTYIKNRSQKLKVISKLSACTVEEAEGIFLGSLGKLNINKFYGYLIHNFQFYKENKQLWVFLEKLKKEGKIEKIGFSLYFPNELEYVLGRNLKIDLIQIPFSIFDQRFLPYFPELKNRGIEINARSVFLQGLVFIEPEALNSRLTRIKEKLKNLNVLSKKNKLSIVTLCINFVLFNKMIDKVVIGVDNLENFREIIASLNDSSRVKEIMPELSEFREDDEKIILPFNWEPLKANA